VREEQQEGKEVRKGRKKESSTGLKEAELDVH
jgi:hypothetical protein